MILYKYLLGSTYIKRYHKVLKMEAHVGVELQKKLEVFREHIPHDMCFDNVSLKQISYCASRCQILVQEKPSEDWECDILTGLN